MNNFSLITLLITLLILMNMYIYISKKKNSNILYKEFKILFILLGIYTIGFICQILFKNSNISPVKFEYISNIGITLSPVIACFIAISYWNEKVNLKKFLFLIIIPIITLVLLYIDDKFLFENYSINMDKMVYGKWFLVHSVYTYSLYLFSLILILVGAIRKSGFLSKQTFLIGLGVLVPICINILFILNVIKATVYYTPMIFTFSASCLAFTIIKYKALNITPIAFRTIIDTMSDAFIVISNDGTIVDKNLTFENTFKEIFNVNKNENFFDIIDNTDIIDLKNFKKHIEETRNRKEIVSKQYCIKNEKICKYFEVDVHPMKGKHVSIYIGTLLLFKDVTEHKNYIKEIQDKQDVIVKQGQLVSIGELAGGMAHDINTPISAIKAGIHMLEDMYEPRDETEKELLFRMSNCTEKIIKIVNSMRNQIRNLGSNQKINFKISDIIKDVKIIAYNEIQRNKCELIIKIEDDLYVNGDPTKLGQVFTNLIINSVQAYNGKGGKIEVTVIKAPGNKVMITVRDYANGIPKEIQDYVFKNILTTKGTKGTGLGLYLAYSVIKGEFSGDITFESTEGGGTTFYIIMNRAEEEIEKKEEIEK